MRRILKSGPLLLAACLLALAEDPSWKSKPMRQWDQEDAKQVLTDSPWAKSVTPQWVRDLSPDERRDSGDLEADQGKGVGLEGLVGIFDPAKAAEAVARAHAKPIREPCWFAGKAPGQCARRNSDYPTRKLPR